MTNAALARQHYERPDIARFYGAWQDLLPAEKALLEIYRQQISGRRVLDLGCGGGRTSLWLHPLAADYLGVDYSARMVEVCRGQYPDMKFEQADATCLTSLADASFDFVLFSYNGLDTMSHQQRLRALAEVHRVLGAGGWFAFSSHSIEYDHIVTAFDRRAGFSVRGLHRNLKNLRSYLRVRRQQVRASTYAILSDPREGSSQLSYFISRKNQLAQLQAAGFVDTRILSWTGEPISADRPDAASMAFYYICRKPGSTDSEAATAPPHRTAR